MILIILLCEQAAGAATEVIALILGPLWHCHCLWTVNDSTDKSKRAPLCSQNPSIFAVIADKGKFFYLIRQTKMAKKALCPTFLAF